MNRRTTSQCLGMGILLLSGSTFVLSQTGPTKTSKVVEADAFVLRDRQGQRRAELGLHDDQPGLTLFDAKGQRRVRLTVLADGTSQLVFSDEKGTEQRAVQIGPNGEPTVSRVNPGSKDEIKAAGPAEVSSTAVRPAKLERAGGDGLVRRGEPLYRQYCASCHANDGHGARVRNRMPKIPDFGNAQWQASRTEAQLLVSILEGRGADMPPFSAELSADDGRALTAYVRAFGGILPARASAPLSDFETQLRQLQQQWEELDRQARALRDGGE